MEGGRRGLQGADADERLVAQRRGVQRDERAGGEVEHLGVLPVQAAVLDDGLRVVQVGQQQPGAGGLDRGERGAPLGNDLGELDVAPGGPVEVDTDDAAQRGVEVGLEVELVAVDAHEPVLGVSGVDDLDRLAPRGAPTLGDQRVGPEPVGPLGAADDGDDQPAVVVRHLAGRLRLGLVGKGEEQFVVAVEAVHHQAGGPQPGGGGAARVGVLVEGRVQERAVVGQPRRKGELGDDLALKVVTRDEVADAEVLPVRAALAAGVGHERSVAGHGERGQRRCAVLAPGVGVEHDLSPGHELVQRGGGVPEVLGGGAVVAADEPAAAALDRDARARPGDDAAHELGEPRPGRQLGQRRLGVGLLLGNPRGHGGVVGVLEPAVGVGDLGAVEVLDEIVAARVRVGHAGESTDHGWGGPGWCAVRAHGTVAVAMVL